MNAAETNTAGINEATAATGPATTPGNPRGDATRPPVAGENPPFENSDFESPVLRARRARF
ncbi:hypothetical protein GCM10009603_55890 [Nocardiopsis exhalans]